MEIVIILWHDLCEMFDVVFRSRLVTKSGKEHGD